MTVNISLCMIVLIAGATLGHSPLNVIQLLWTNLIMDILAAIAIGTEPYMQDVVLREGDEQNKKATRISRREAIILPEMWRNIFGAVVYQLIVLLVLVYFGEFIFFPKPFNIIYEELRDENGPTDRLVMDTIIFHTFILMNLFNQINCRVVEADEFNVFKTLFNNPTFWFVFLFEMVVYLMAIGFQAYWADVTRRFDFCLVIITKLKKSSFFRRKNEIFSKFLFSFFSPRPKSELAFFNSNDLKKML